jgi:hypothetical protein
MLEGELWHNRIPQNLGLGAIRKSTVGSGAVEVQQFEIR